MRCDEKGDLKEYTCLLQVANTSTYRTRPHVDVDLEDWRAAAIYAHRFNTHLFEKLKSDADSDVGALEDVHGIRVSAPVGCDVLGSGLPQFIGAGDAVLLAPCEPTEIQKLVFDGREEFHELPQAFFHYASWSSGGRELVCDIQGREEDDGSFLILDPCVLRKSPPSVADLVLGATLLGNSQNDSVDGRFELMHPKCGQMCKTFDPQRIGAHLRNHCGVCRSCGL